MRSPRIEYKCGVIYSGVAHAAPFHRSIRLAVTPVIKKPDYNLVNAVSDNRLLGLWRMMIGYRHIYLAATIGLGIAALSKTATYLLLRFFIDDILGQGYGWQTLVLVGLGFVGLALFEGTFTWALGSK